MASRSVVHHPVGNDEGRAAAVPLATSTTAREGSKRETGSIVLTRECWLPRFEGGGMQYRR